MSQKQYSKQQMISRYKSKAFEACCFFAMLLCVLFLLIFLGNILYKGIGGLRWEFLTSFPSRHAEKAGILSAIAGTLWLSALTALFSLPIGIGAAIYLEEYAASGRWKKLVQLNIANLAGVPSIVYGILGLALFVQAFALGSSVISGALTLSLVVLPIVILASQEALRAVPDSIRHASFALGASRWQTVWFQVLPAAIPGIMTGVIFAISRAIGEAAPLVTIGAVAYAPFVPSGPTDQFTALPIQIYNWAARSQEEFHVLAAQAIVSLLFVLFILNSGAMYIRYRFGKKMAW